MITDCRWRHRNNPCMINLLCRVAKWQSCKVAKWQSGRSQYRNLHFVSILLVLSLSACRSTGIHHHQRQCGGGSGSSSGFCSCVEPIWFALPVHHGAHPEYRTEWWYYTGNLSSEDGQQFGYQLTFFRNALFAYPGATGFHRATNQIYMAHFAVTDGAGGKHHSFERFSRAGDNLAGARKRTPV